MFKFFLAIIAYCIKVLTSKDETYIRVRKTLLTSESFEYPEKDKGNIWLSLSTARRAMSSVLFGEYKRLQTKDVSGVGIIVSTEAELESKSNYVSKNSSETTVCGIAKATAIIPRHWLVRLLFAGFILVSHIALFPILVFSRYDKRNLVGLPQTFLSFLVIASFFKKNKCEKLYMFYIWHSDTNLIERWVVKSAIPVYFVPLENPMSMFSANLIGKEFVAVLPYHKEEVRFFYNAKIDDENCWAVESQDKIENGEIPSDINKNEIAIYSHGSYVRQMLGHPVPSVGDIGSEMSFFQALKPLIVEGRWKFVIHMHPKEKSDKETLNWSLDNYRKLLGDNVHFANIESSTYSQMRKYNLAIGSISSVLFERQAMGYMTLIFAENISGFPLTSSKMNELVVRNQDELILKINHFLNMSQTDYQEQYAQYIY